MIHPLSFIGTPFSNTSQGNILLVSASLANIFNKCQKRRFFIKKKIEFGNIKNEVKGELNFFYALNDFVFTCERGV